MNRTPTPKRTLALLVAALHLATGPMAYAAPTDLSNTPLANVSGTSAVRPNLMFLLDDSGSMMQQYTPDYVSERWGAQATSDMHCRNSLDTQVRVTPGRVNTDANTNRDLCVLGDPPYMSADFNKQYYNPAIVYTPPVNYLGTSYASMDSATTSGWTSVLTDGFNEQNLNQLEGSASNVDLTTGVPSRVWCNSALGASCVDNTGDYIYPEALGGTYRYNFDAGANNNRYAFVPPYYFDIASAEYCDSLNLTSCQYIRKGSTPPLGWIPTKVRWCDNVTDANRQHDGTANMFGGQPAAGKCQAKKTGSFQYARFSSYAKSTTAYGTIRIGNSGSSDPVSIADIKVGTVVVTNGAETVAGTLIPANRAALATALAGSINTRVSAPDYRACAGAACAGDVNVGIALADDTLAVYPVVPAASFPPMTVNAPSSHLARAYGVISVDRTRSSRSVDSIRVNGVEILSGSIALATDNAANRAAAAAAISARINTYLNVTPWEYTAATNVAGTLCNAANKVCVYPPNIPNPPGAAANGYAINVTVSGSGVTISTIKFAGGVSRFIPTSVTSIGSVSAFSRVDIIPGGTYPRAAGRSDCVASAGSCTYEEEMTNYANWYAYYRTRMQMMKTSVGQAFLPLNTDYRLGFTTINNTDFSGTSNDRWLALADLDNSQKQSWYGKLYTQSPSGSTPLRNALDRMGQLYEGTLSGAPDPIQFSCQQNFTILTTDGYWNQSFTGYGDQDNSNTSSDDHDFPFCNRSNGCYDGNLGGGSANSLADVALYYYKRDLRPSLTDNVFSSTSDPNTAQHMTTFTIGLGVDGVMTFREDYATATAGDFYHIRTGSTNPVDRSSCPWQAAGTVCNWPVPAADTETAVDDLWHAAVNGHGTYFSAKDPESMARGLANALNNLKVRNGAASASATSTPNVTQEDNDIFSATFRTVKWDGELVAQKIDPATGNLMPTVTWQAQALLDLRTDVASDSRTIYTLDGAGPSASRKSFTWSDLTASERAYFDGKCPLLSQCGDLGAAEKALANNGERMLEYLRGQRALEVGSPPIYRDRDHTLGDIASAKPAYVRNPRRNYGDAGYTAFKAANATRQAMVYVAANDGLLHALNATTGEEAWAYVPHMILPELYRLADNNYANNHRYYVDGSPESADVYINGEWRTILVGGLNKGGRGYYALDITDPADPQVLWEFCSDAAQCARSDADLGYTYGNPIITKRPSDGKWVVIFTSGYNNVSPGDGKGYFYVVDAADGTLLNKVGTNVGDTTTPSGLARITGLALNAQTNNTVTYVYGGDLLGNLWRLDMSSMGITQLASLTDYAGATQPITSRPELGLCDNQVMVFAGTGKYLGISDLSDTQRQTMYGIKDSTTSHSAFRTSGAVQQSFAPLGGGGYTITSNPVDLAATPGWYVDFDQNAGERVNLDPQLIFGNLLVVTSQPTDISACTTGGNSYKYEFSYCSGSFLLASPNQQVGAKLASSIVVGFIVIRLPSGALKVVTTFASGEKTTGEVTGSSTGKVRRVSWRELTQ